MNKAEKKTCHWSNSTNLLQVEIVVQLIWHYTRTLIWKSLLGVFGESLGVASKLGATSFSKLRRCWNKKHKFVFRLLSFVYGKNRMLEFSSKKYVLILFNYINWVLFFFLWYIACISLRNFPWQICVWIREFLYFFPIIVLIFAAFLVWVLENFFQGGT